MWTQLRDLWLDKAEFRAAMRALYVTGGLFLAAFAPYVARWTGADVDAVRGLGVLLAGASTAINAGQQNPR
jgi:hypothetical protein